MDYIKKTIRRHQRETDHEETSRPRSMSYPGLDQATKNYITNAYDAWFRNNTRATDILHYILADLKEKDTVMFMSMVSDVLADENQVKEFKKFILQNIAIQRFRTKSRNDGSLRESDPSLNQRIKEDIVDAYTAWYRNFKKAKVILHDTLDELDKKDIGLFLGMVSDVLQERQMVDEFKEFIRRNLPSHLSSSMPESQLDHSSLNALIVSMHYRISAMEAKLSQR